MAVRLFRISVLLFCLIKSVINLSAQKVLIIDYCIVEDGDPDYLFDTIKVFVHVSVDDTSSTNDDTMVGDIYYWYQTDSMVSAGTPPRLINNSLVSINIPTSGKFDTLYVDVRPEEIMAGFYNTICLWPVINTAELVDTVECCTTWLAPILGEETNTSVNIQVLPNPTTGPLFINMPLESNEYSYLITDISGRILISEVLIPNLEVIDLHDLQSGIYIVSVVVKNRTFSFKVIKQ